MSAHFLSTPRSEPAHSLGVSLGATNLTARCRGPAAKEYGGTIDDSSCGAGASLSMIGIEGAAGSPTEAGDGGEEGSAIANSGEITVVTSIGLLLELAA
jgi:hypothetical protein